MLRLVISVFCFFLQAGFLFCTFAGYNLKTMSEEKPKKKRKKNAAAEEDGGEKAHKKPWTETYATVEEIKAFLRDHVYLRFNVVRHQVEARLPAEDPFFASEEFHQFVTGDWLEMSDRLFNTLLDALKTIKPTRDTDLKTVLESGFVPPFHPFQYYLNRLPPWDGQNHILLAVGTSPVLGLTVEKIGSAMRALGFKPHRSHGRRGYRVVAYKSDEIEANRRLLAYDAEPDDGQGDRGDT